MKVSLVKQKTFNTISILVISIFFLSKMLNASVAFPSEIQGYKAKNLLTSKEVLLSFDDPKQIKVLVFLSMNCPCSTSHIPIIKKLFTEYKDKRIEFIGVHSNSDESEADAKDFFIKQDLAFPIIQDEGSKIANLLLALKTPHVFVIQGKEVKYHGGVDNSKIAQNADKPYLKEALDLLVQGKQPIVKEARTLGCIIKRP